MFGLSKKWDVDFIPTLLFVFAAVMWRTDYYRLCLYGAIPIMIVYTFWFKKADVLCCRYWKHYATIILLIILSTIVNAHSAVATSLLVPIVATFLISLSVYALTLNGNNSKILSIAFIGLFASIMYATLTGDNFVANFDYANEADRRGNTILNSNQYAYFSLFAIIATRVLMGHRDKLWSIAKVLIYVTLTVCACYTALMTASRQVLLLELPLIAYYFYDDILRNGKGSSKLLFVIVLVGILVYGAPIFFQYYDNSYLATRFETSLNGDSRMYLLKNAFFEGLENPILGLGLDADTTFSHCTYTHLFSRCGILCAALYMYIIINAIVCQIRRWKTTRDTYYNIIIVSLIIFAIANFFYSYIDQPYMMPILFLLLGEADKYTKEFYSSL